MITKIITMIFTITIAITIIITIALTNRIAITISIKRKGIFKETTYRLNVKFVLFEKLGSKSNTALIVVKSQASNIYRFT